MNEVAMVKARRQGAKGAKSKIGKNNTIAEVVMEEEEEKAVMTIKAGKKQTGLPGLESQASTDVPSQFLESNIVTSSMARESLTLVSSSEDSVSGRTRKMSTAISSKRSKRRTTRRNSEAQTEDRSERSRASSLRTNESTGASDIRRHIQVSFDLPADRYFPGGDGDDVILMASVESHTHRAEEVDLDNMDVVELEAVSVEQPPPLSSSPVGNRRMSLSSSLSSKRVSRRRESRVSANNNKVPEVDQ